MSEAKHTPGPWEIGRSAKMSSAKTGNCVATVFPRGNRGDHKTSIRITMVDEENIEETDANARLIAAAPDLMAACEAIVQVPNMKMSPQVKVVARQCLAALNKAVAEGEGDDMSEAKHSPLPWRFDATGRYVYDADNVIAKCDGPSTYDGGLPAEEIEANGEFIVLACNSHDDLLDVVHRLVAYINQGCIATYDEWHEMFRDAKAAIAKVEEA